MPFPCLLLPSDHADHTSYDQNTGVEVDNVFIYTATVELILRDLDSQGRAYLPGQQVPIWSAVVGIEELG